MEDNKNRLLGYIVAWSIALLIPLSGYAQWTKSYNSHIKSVQTILNDDWLLLPVMTLNSDDILTISFDAMSHSYSRYTYHITHCNANWEPSDIYESDYIDGFNDMPIDDYENSINTTFEYTHYTFNLPNNDTSLKLSGNYLLEIIDEDDNTVADIKFAIVEPIAKIGLSVSTNTDKDINGKHQQISLSINHSALRVLDQTKEIIPVVLMNRNIETAVRDFKPTHRSNGKLEYTHCADLIFNAGNEYRRFEIIDMYDYTQNVDRIDFHNPYYHATLLTDYPHVTYRYDMDHNGRYLIRKHNAYNNDIEADYLFVHFVLSMNKQHEGEVYLRGDFSGNAISEEWKMVYDNNLKAYTITALLKQGAYDYQYILTSNSNNSLTAKTEGDCYETKNEYSVLVYFREVGSRYDRLVGYSN